MSSGSAIRGSRVGSSPMRPDERSEPAPRREVTYWCAAGHEVDVRFAADVTPPETWDCVRCGQPAGLDRSNPPGRLRVEPYKSHLAYVKERRSDADGAAILAEALAKVRQRRGRSE
ncbi:RNA polymerase-binding protein RbpA [Couchioplanes caeruleus]|uniref:RNA polymerase-binding protein RbpA n=1 Tax=Couchioplanes caeruleus TaxID=56438 RepID=UPI0020C116DF|nr:RNA polymerase-binding protein RbpA [Couchioplanes caeruleus]UQU63053.1 RNA polymerase-binding protein RbpA [Couchioplanes caeruleus]